MFLDELTPFLQEMTRQPVAFVGGFVSGLLRLDLNQEPLKDWLAQQETSGSGSGDDDHSGTPPSNGGPQKISIE